ncbi:MAG TPA: hypothetical protein PKX91_03695 [Clostridia bacterium]|jgi:hypothetical protein|nr:hypothetical protein [Clostridia bacterium]
MQTVEIIVIVLASLFVVATIGGTILHRILAKKSGKTVTSCGCLNSSGCAGCIHANKCASQKENIQQEEIAQKEIK